MTKIIGKEIVTCRNQQRVFFQPWIQKKELCSTWMTKMVLMHGISSTGLLHTYIEMSENKLKTLVLVVEYVI